MEFKIFGKYQNIALVVTDELLIHDVESAMQLITTVKKGVNCRKFIISKSCVQDDFFSPATKYTAEVLRKYVNSHIQIAIVGDYSCFEGQPTMTFLNNINRGDRIFFTNDMDEAIKRLEVDI
ncbi:MAG: DUF4180 domain-containing protein [Coprobacillus sp.]